MRVKIVLVAILNLMFYPSLLNAGPLGQVQRPQETVINHLKIPDSSKHDSFAMSNGLQLGNGRQAAVIGGFPIDDCIVLNELSLWGGGPQDSDKKDAYKFLPEIRKLAFSGDKKALEEVVSKNFLCAGDGPGSRLTDENGRSLQGRTPFGSYQTLGLLNMSFKNIPEGVTNYKSTLDLRTAVATVQFKYNNYTQKREYFVSFPAKAMIVKITTDDPKGVVCDIFQDRPKQEDYEMQQFGKVDDSTIYMYGQVSSYKGDNKGVKYASLVHAESPNGMISTSDDGVLKVRGARTLYLFQAAKTDYNGPDGRRAEDPKVAAEKVVAKLNKEDYDALKEAHIKDYQSYFNRVSMAFGPENSALAEMDIQERAIAHTKDPASDPSFTGLIYNVGRYFLISSTRPGGLPPNLQGIWARGLSPNWNCDYHLDINVEMNYWPAEISDMHDIHGTLIDYIENVIVPNGKKSAKEYWNVDDGWTCFLTSNVWGFTSPNHRGASSVAISSAAWLCQQLWWYYDYSRDPAVLKRIYPLMKGALNTYIEGILVEHPETHELVAVPTHSPETGPITYGVAIDSQTIRELMKNTIHAAELLGVDADYRERVKKKLAQMPPDRIDENGYLCEWYDHGAAMSHRHISLMWGLYPGVEMSLEGTPELVPGILKSLTARGVRTTGWGMAHRMNCWARLRNPEMVGKIFTIFSAPFWTPVKSPYGLFDPPSASEKSKSLKKSKNKRRKTEDSIDKYYQGRLLPNLFALHPPFQIDASFGVASGIAEALLSSYPDRIILLPALPKEWGESGSVKGLKARGNISVDIEWKNGKLTNCTLISPIAQVIEVVYGTEKRTVQLQPSKPWSWN